MNRLELDSKSTIFDRADPALVSHYVNEHVGPHRISIQNRHRMTAEVRHRRLSALDLCQIRYGNRVHVTSPGLENIFHLQVVLQGRCQWTHRGQIDVLGPGELLMLNPDEQVDLVYSDDCNKFVLKLPRALLHRAATESHRMLTENTLVFDAARYRMTAVPGLHELLTLILSESCHAATSESLKQHYASALCTKLLDHFPTNTVVDHLTGEAPAFDRLIELIDAQIATPMSIETIARKARMSTRSVYSLFKRRVGTSPIQYIRQRRLEGVHRMLSESTTPQATQITAVALAFGFSHLGRFSAQYQRQYGELPSETLRRRAE